MKAVVAAFNQEKALVGAFSVIVKTGCGTDGSFYSTSSNMLICPLLQLTGIMNHDWVSVPLVYTQTVTLAVYFYFTAALIGAQWISPARWVLLTAAQCAVISNTQQGGVQDGLLAAGGGHGRQAGHVLPLLPHHPVCFLL